MARNPGVAKQKRLMTRKRLLIIGTLTGIVILFILFSPYGVYTRYSLESDTSDIREKLIENKRIVDSLRTQVDFLLRDTTEIERLARERYGYIRAGDEVFIIKR